MRREIVLSIVPTKSALAERDDAMTILETKELQRAAAVVEYSKPPL